MSPKLNLNLRKLKKLHRSPVMFGAVLTFLFLAFTQFYYYRLNSNAEASRQSLLFKGIERIDHFFYDLRFQSSIYDSNSFIDPSLIFVAVDEKSLETLGRWPWDRSQIGKMLESIMQYQPKAVAFDMAFSEKQNDQASDGYLADVVKKYNKQIVLGVFASSPAEEYEPYQDYCLTEYMNYVQTYESAQAKKKGSYELVSFELGQRLNIADNSGEFEDFDGAPFSDFFKNRFDEIKSYYQEDAEFLQEQFAVKDFKSLTGIQKKSLESFWKSRLRNYCRAWLKTDKNLSRYLNVPELQADFRKVFAESNEYNKLEFNELISKFTHSVKSNPIIQYESWVLNTFDIQSASIFSGSFVVGNPDSDGYLRSYPLVFRTGNKAGTSYIPSLALATYLAAFPDRALLLDISENPEHKEQKSISNFGVISVDELGQQKEKLFSFPTDGQGRIKAFYQGGANTFKQVSASDFFNGTESIEVSQTSYVKGEIGRAQVSKVKKSELLKNAIVVIGASATGLYDIRVTPTSEFFLGPEVHLTVLNSLMNNRFLKSFENEKRAAFRTVIAIGFVTTMLVSYAGPLLGFLSFVLILSLMALVDVYSFRNGYVASIGIPMVFAFFSYLGLTIFKYLMEESQKKRFRSTFAKYVSPAIVDEILKDSENVELGGRKMTVSVLFSDVRGFTTFSEKLDPQTLSAILNRYLTPMTEIIFKNKGTLDKYIGDAIMAFFGAPIETPHHAVDACRTAMESIRKLKSLAKEFKSEGLPDIDIGIGINTALVSVGNMGSEIVRNYTVMGDGVNLASRLEGLSKEYGVRVIVSEHTHELIKEHFLTRELDRVRVKGKAEAVRIFEVIEEKSQIGTDGPWEWTRQRVVVFEEALALYYQGDFRKALVKFLKCIELNRPEVVFDPYLQDKASDLFAARCEEYLQNPPTTTWDGVYNLDHK